MIKFGTYRVPSGLVLNGFHVWNPAGKWAGVYQSQARASAELNNL